MRYDIDLLSLDPGSYPSTSYTQHHDVAERVSSADNNPTSLQSYHNITRENNPGPENDRNTPISNSAFKQPNGARPSLGSSDRVMPPPLPPPPLIQVNDPIESKRFTKDEPSSSQNR